MTDVYNWIPLSYEFPHKHLVRFRTNTLRDSTQTPCEISHKHIVRFSDTMHVVPVTMFVAVGVMLAAVIGLI